MRRRRQIQRTYRSESVANVVYERVTEVAASRGHLNRTRMGGLGGLVGGVVGSLSGPVGAAVGAAIGAGLGAAIGDDLDH